MRLATTVQHRFHADGVPYVYASSSASVLRLDQVSLALLDGFAAGGDLESVLDRLPVERDEGEDTLTGLMAMGLVRPIELGSPPGADLPPMPFPLATLVLNVTNKCNLSCTYCYEYGEDRVAEPRRSDGTAKAPIMNAEVARQSVDFLFANSGARREISITFFGGETLLNFGVIRATVEHANARAAETARRVGFALTTNATLLTDEVIDFLMAHRFGINVSIDGRREQHDRHRRDHAGRGSYDAIRPRIERLLARRGPNGRPIGARVTLTRGSTGLRDMFHHLVDEIGFDAVGFAPVTSSPGRDYALTGEEYDALLAEFRCLAEDYVRSALDGRPHGFSNLEDLIRELHQGINKAHPCGAGLGLLGVSTEGELGLCHRFVESGEHAVGSVQGGLDDRRRREFLAAGHVNKKLECSECFARPVCAGGCYHEAQVHYGDASRPNLHLCDWIRDWTAIGLESYGRIANGNPQWLVRFEESRS